jgi:hypothetical protein
MSKILILFASLTILTASRPADQIRYSLPRVLEFQRQVDYGIQSSNLSFTLRSKFDLKNVKVILHSSHKGLLIEKVSGPARDLSFEQDFAKGKLYEFHFRALVKEKFTLASVTVFLKFPFPAELLSIWVADNAEKLYSNQSARNNLLIKIATTGSLHEERFGIFLYGEKIGWR